MKWCIERKKKIAIVMMIMFSVMTTLSSVKAYSLDDVRFVLPYLETDNFFNDVLRTLGKWIYDFMGGFLTYAEEGFTSLMDWDIMSLPIVREIMTRFDVVLYSLLFIAFIGVVVVRMFMFQNTMKVIYNVFMTMMIISCMTLILGLISTAKSDMVAETNAIIKGANNDTMSVMLYKENTVDIVQSMKKGGIVKLSNIGNLDLNYVNTSLRINRDVLNEYYTYNDNGGRDTEELNDGVFGMGDERYYRYRTDYFSVNITIILSVVVYILAIFKLTYLTWQWFNVNFFGKIGLAKGFWDLNNIGKVMKNALNTASGMVILYFSMMLFSVLSSNILASDDLNNWLVKSVMVFSIGMAIVVGSGFVNDFLGIDDGSNFALKSVFMAQRIGRMSKGAVNSSRNIIGAPIRAMDKGNEALGQVGNHFRNDNNSSGINTNTNNYDDDSNKYSNNETGRSHVVGGVKNASDSTRQAERQKRFQDYYDKINPQEEYRENMNTSYRVNHMNNYDGNSNRNSNNETGRSHVGGGVKYSSDNTRQVERQKRFQEFYDNKYSQNENGNNKENDLYSQSRSKDNFQDLEKGNKSGYVNQRKYRPYKPSHVNDDEELDMLEQENKEKMLKRSGQ